MTTNHMPIVRDLADQVPSVDPRLPARSFFPPSFEEVIGLAEQMRLSLPEDTDLEQAIGRLWAAHAAVDEATAQINATEVPADLLDLDPAEITARVLDAMRDRAVRDTLSFQQAMHWTDAIARHASGILREAADRFVIAQRVDFDKHVRVIKKAAAAGLSQHTDLGELLESGAPEAIKAYRDLPAAARGLDQIAALRVSMIKILDYGQIDPPVLAFVTDPGGPLEVESADNIWEGETHLAQYDQEFRGSAVVNVYTQRLGGRWLALINAGHTLRLNTADEALGKGKA